MRSSNFFTNLSFSNSPKQKYLFFFIAFLCLAFITVYASGCGGDSGGGGSTGGGDDGGGDGGGSQVVGLEIIPGNVTVNQGATQQFKVIQRFADGSYTDVTSDVEWVLDDTSSGTISSDGTFTASTRGTVPMIITLIARYLGYTSNQVIINIIGATSTVKLSSIEIAPLSATVASGGTCQFSANGRYSNGTTQNLTNSVTWNTDNSAAGTFTTTSAGLFRASTTATTLTARVTAAKDSITSNSAAVTVTGSGGGGGGSTVTLASLEVTPNSADIFPGRTQQFKATGRYTNGTSQDLTSQVIWNNSNSAAGSFSSTTKGLFTGTSNIAPGRTTNISASYSGKTSAQVAVQVRYVWKILLIVYRNTDLHFTDSTGVRRDFTATMPDWELNKALDSYRAFADVARNFSNGCCEIKEDTVYADRPITSVTHLGNNSYWANYNDVHAEIDRFAPDGKYDSIIVHWYKTDKIPAYGWGYTIYRGPWSNMATYTVITDASEGTWNTGTFGEIFLHEWLHGACSFYRGDLGAPMPNGDADGADSHGYTWSWSTGHAAYYKDLMTGRVLENGAYLGISPAVWAKGTVLSFMNSPRTKTNPLEVPPLPTAAGK